MELPNKKLTQTDLENLKPVEDLERLEMKMTRLLLDVNECAIAVLHADGKDFPYPLNADEGTMLTFVKSGLGDSAHIKTIYQLFLESHRQRDCSLISVTIEAKVGDVMYARLEWQDHKLRRFFNVISPGGAMILACLADVPMYILRKALDEMEELDEDWPHEDEIYGSE